MSSISIDDDTNELQRDREAVRFALAQADHFIARTMPNGPEQTIARNKLREARMWWQEGSDMYDALFTPHDVKEGSLAEDAVDLNAAFDPPHDTSANRRANAESAGLPRTPKS